MLVVYRISGARDFGRQTEEDEFRVDFSILVYIEVVVAQLVAAGLQFTSVHAHGHQLEDWQPTDKGDNSNSCR